jgi:hypothetical protein
MTTFECERLTGLARNIADTYPDALYTCGYCGAVYKKYPDQQVFGFLDNGILGQGWHPK